VLQRTRKRFLRKRKYVPRKLQRKLKINLPKKIRLRSTYLKPRLKKTNINRNPVVILESQYKNPSYFNCIRNQLLKEITEINLRGILPFKNLSEPVKTYISQDLFYFFYDYKGPIMSISLLDFIILNIQSIVKTLNFIYKQKLKKNYSIQKKNSLCTKYY